MIPLATFFVTCQRAAFPEITLSTFPATSATFPAALAVSLSQFLSARHSTDRPTPRRAISTPVRLPNFASHFAANAQPVTSPAMVTKSFAISHCFQLFIIFQSSCIIWIHFSPRSSTIARELLLATNSASFISHSVFFWRSSELLSILYDRYRGRSMSPAGIFVINLIASSTHDPISLASRIERSLPLCNESENGLSAILWSSSSEKFQALFMARSASHADPFSPNIACVI